MYSDKYVFAIPVRRRYNLGPHSRREATLKENGQAQASDGGLIYSVINQQRRWGYSLIKNDAGTGTQQGRMEAYRRLCKIRQFHRGSLCRNLIMF